MDQKPKFYFVYRTTNLINGKYIGCHRTSNLDDGYLGSGLILGYSINKYGKENFERIILEFFDCQEQMLFRERELVTEETLADPFCMNIQLGGNSGWSRAISLMLGKRGRAKWAQMCKENPQLGIENSLRTKKMWQDGKIPRNCRSWLGKQHKEETKRKIGAKSSIHQMGYGNSQSGTVWMTNINEQQNRKARSNEIESLQLDGWILGRKIYKRP